MDVSCTKWYAVWRSIMVVPLDKSLSSFKTSFRAASGFQDERFAVFRNRDFGHAAMILVTACDELDPFPVRVPVPFAALRTHFLKIRQQGDQRCGDGKYIYMQILMRCSLQGSYHGGTNVKALVTPERGLQACHHFFYTIGLCNAARIAPCRMVESSVGTWIVAPSADSACVLAAALSAAFRGDEEAILVCSKYCAMYDTVRCEDPYLKLARELRRLPAPARFSA